MPPDTHQPFIDLVNQATGDKGTTQLLLDIADKINFQWFEWAFKVALVVLAFLFFKDFVYNIFYYIRIRYDKFVGVGALVKLDQNMIGRIKDYDFQYIVVETDSGFVRIPLSKWCKDPWTQLKTASYDIREIRKEKEKLEVKYFQLQEDLHDVKSKLEDYVQHPPIQCQDSTSNIQLNRNKITDTPPVIHP